MFGLLAGVISGSLWMIVGFLIGIPVLVALGALGGHLTGWFVGDQISAFFQLFSFNWQPWEIGAVLAFFSVFLPIIGGTGKNILYYLGWRAFMLALGAPIYAIACAGGGWIVGYFLDARITEVFEKMTGLGWHTWEIAAVLGFYLIMLIPTSAGSDDEKEEPATS